MAKHYQGEVSQRKPGPWFEMLWYAEGSSMKEGPDTLKCKGTNSYQIVQPQIAQVERVGELYFSTYSTQPYHVIINTNVQLYPCRYYLHETFRLELKGNLHLPNLKCVHLQRPLWGINVNDSWPL